MDDCINCILHPEVLNTDQLHLYNNIVEVLNVNITGDIYPEILEILTSNKVHQVTVTVGFEETVMEVYLIE